MYFAVRRQMIASRRAAWSCVRAVPSDRWGRLPGPCGSDHDTHPPCHFRVI